MGDQNQRRVVYLNLPTARVRPLDEMQKVEKFTLERAKSVASLRAKKSESKL